MGERYRIVRVIARGGTGIVYEAEHTWTERRVALKMLLPRHADGAAQIRRFQQEARAAAKLVHPNIVEVIDMGRDGDDGSLFMVQALLVGEDLEQRLERVKRLRPAELLQVVRPILDALQTAHTAGVLHRDIKPSNIFLVAGEGAEPASVFRSPGAFVPKLIDFGASKRLDDDSDLAKLTQTGSLIGTPVYMSPEQIRGAPLDVRTDIWSVGVVMHKALTGRYPFDASNFAVLFSQILTSRAPRIDRADVPPYLADVVHRCLSTDREERFPSIAALIDALDAPPPARREIPPVSDERTLIDAGIREELAEAQLGRDLFASIADELTNVPAENERIEDSVDEIVASGTAPARHAIRVVAEPGHDLPHPPAGGPKPRAPAEPTPTPLAIHKKPASRPLPGRRPGLAPWRGDVRMGLVAAPRHMDKDLLRSIEALLSKPRDDGPRPQAPGRWKLRRFASYSTLVDALCEDEIELAWLPPVAYLRARRLGPVHLLLGLARNGQASYGSALVASQRAGIQGLSDLRGKRVAWVDVWSAAGYLMPRGVLRLSGIDPTQVFASQAFVGSHAAVLDAIAEGRADVGATYCTLGEDGDLIASPWADRPGFTPVAVSGAIPGDAVCAAGELSLRDAEAMVEPLIDLAEDPEAAPLLKRLFGTARFVGIDASDYQVLEGV